MTQQDKKSTTECSRKDELENTHLIKSKKSKMSEKIGQNGHSILQKEMPSDLFLKYVLNKEIKEMKTEELKGKYTILIFYPFDFTFVCPVELTRVSNRKKEFDELEANVLFISTDSVFSHLQWSSIDGGVPNLKFPMVSDFNKELSEFFNLKNLEGHSERATVFLDKEMRVRSYLISDPRISRSDDECLRILKGLKFVDLNKDKFFFENKF